MMPIRNLPGNKRFCRRELIIALDLIAACIFVQVFLDHSIVTFVTRINQSPIFLLLSFVPDRVQMSLILISGMMVLIAYRIKTGDRFGADRGMFVLGCGAVAGFSADLLKVVFGRARPDSALIDSAYAFHFFGGTQGLDSFPSSHAAIAAGVAGALSAIWPAHRWTFICFAVVIAVTRFLSGAHYPSDSLFGFAVGLGAVFVVQVLFDRCGIYLHPRNTRS